MKSSSPSPTWVLGVANPPFRWAGWAVTSQVGFGVVTWWEGDTDTKASPTAASSRQPATSTATRVAPCPLEDVWRPMAYHSLGQWRLVWALQQKHHQNRVSKQIVSHLESSAPNTRRKKCVCCRKRCIFTRGCEKSDTSQGSQGTVKNWSPTPLPATKGVEGTEAAASTTFSHKTTRRKPQRHQISGYNNHSRLLQKKNTNLEDFFFPDGFFSLPSKQLPTVGGSQHAPLQVHRHLYRQDCHWTVPWFQLRHAIGGHASIHPKQKKR